MIFIYFFNFAFVNFAEPVDIDKAIGNYLMFK